MLTKKFSVVLLVLVGIYFLVFHSSPFPFSHDAIGLPPFHIFHSAFGVLLLGVAVYLAKKK